MKSSERKIREQKRTKTDGDISEEGNIYRTLFEFIGQGVFYQGADGKLIDINPAALKMFGLTRDEFLERTFYDKEWELVNDNGRSLRAEEFPSIVAFSTGEPVFNLIFGVSNPETKQYSWLIADALPLFQKNKKCPYQVMVTLQDITKRKQAEEALQLEKENFRYSLDNSPLGMRIVTLEGDTIFANKTLLDIYGYDSLEKLQTTPLKDRYTPESYIQALKRKHQREHGDLSTTEYEINIVSNKGEIRHLQVFRKEILWNGISQFQIIYNDITERKNAEEEVLKSKKLLEDLNSHLNEIREEERAIISREIHDQLGQSLTALKLDLNLLKKYIDTNPEAKKKLELMNELVSDTIKNVQRISSDLRPSILDDLGLVPAIEWYCEEFEERSGIKFNIKMDSSDYNDSQVNLILFRIFQETLTNVARHAKASSVDIKLNQHKKGTILTVEDNGIGIPENMIQSPKSMGLINMRERLRPLNGKIDFSSKKGIGTKVTIYIPS